MNPSDRIVVTIFFGIFVEALPFLLAGVLVSSAIHLFVTPERVQRLLPRRPLGAALAGATLGLIFPMCECGAVPTARSLMQKGAAVPLGLAFMLAAPVVNPIVIASTAVAFAGVLGWGFVAERIGLSLAIAVAVALVLGRGSAAQALLARGGDDGHDDGSYHDHDCDHDHGSGPALLRLLRHAGDELFEMGRCLVVGGLLAAGLQVALSPAALLTLRHGVVVPVLVMMALAVVLSICSTVDAFVALSFVGSFAPPALLAFLVFGPMIDLKSTLMFTAAFRRSIVVGIVALTALLVLGAGVALQIQIRR
jgi:uncharacterized membrane protein YraQ (UPF0718 family)